jgi:hypothetical protein
MSHGLSGGDPCIDGPSDGWNSTEVLGGEESNRQRPRLHEGCHHGWVRRCRSRVDVGVVGGRDAGWRRCVAVWRHNE